MQNNFLHSKNLRRDEKKLAKRFILQKQPFTDVSKISVFENLAKKTTNTGVSF